MYLLEKIHRIFYVSFGQGREGGGVFFPLKLTSSVDGIPFRKTFFPLKVTSLVDVMPCTPTIYSADVNCIVTNQLYQWQQEIETSHNSLRSLSNIGHFDSKTASQIPHELVVYRTILFSICIRHMYLCFSLRKFFNMKLQSKGILSR